MAKRETVGTCRLFLRLVIWQSHNTCIVRLLTELSAQNDSTRYECVTVKKDLDHTLIASGSLIDKEGPTLTRFAAATSTQSPSQASIAEMGHLHDQEYFFRADVPPSTNTDRPPPPPLPPRADSSSQTPYSGPPPYAPEAPSYHSQPLTHSWSAQDPRSSSTQSLVPEQALQDGQRTLLLIYIHGFMGNETSFQSFPAHVHNLLSVKLSHTHDVHTKIYPRYKSRKAMENARDDFSKWHVEG